MWVVVRPFCLINMMMIKNDAFRQITYSFRLVFHCLYLVPSEILPTIWELAAHVTTNDLEKYFCSNAAVGVVAQMIVVITFVGDICRIFRDIGLGEVSGSWKFFQGHSKSSKVTRIDRVSMTSY